MTRPLSLLALAAVALMAPSLIWGTLPSHSSMHNLTWAAQFSDQVLSGILYPRWLSGSFDGLGAPTFYFYPPLAFWIDAAIRGLTLDLDDSFLLMPDRWVQPDYMFFVIAAAARS